MIGLRKVRFSYNQHSVIQNLDFSVESGEILSIVGPSGCGKSTLLLLIAGLLQPQHGQVSISNPEEPKENTLRFLFQDYDAFPWQTVWGNVKQSAPRRFWPSDSRVKGMLEDVDLWNSRDKYPG